MSLSAAVAPTVVEEKSAFARAWDKVRQPQADKKKSSKKLYLQMPDGAEYEVPRGVTQSYIDQVSAYHEQTGKYKHAVNKGLGKVSKALSVSGGIIEDQPKGKQTPITKETMDASTENLAASHGVTTPERSARLKKEALAAYIKKHGFNPYDDPARAAKIEAQEFQGKVSDFISPVTQVAGDIIGYSTPAWQMAESTGKVPKGLAGKILTEVAAGVISTPVDIGADLGVIASGKASVGERMGAIANIGLNIGLIDPVDVARAGVKGAKSIVQGAKDVKGAGKTVGNVFADSFKTAEGSGLPKIGDAAEEVKPPKAEPILEAPAAKTAKSTEAPKVEPKPKAGSNKPEPSGLSKSSRAILADTLGTNKPVAIKGKTHADLYDEGKKALDSVDADDEIAELAKNGRPATDVQVGMFAAHRDSLIAELKKLNAKLDKGNIDALADRDLLLNRIADFDRNLDEVKGAAGRSLSALKIGHTVNWSDLDEVKLEAFRIKGSSLTSGTEKQLREMTEKLQKADADLAAREAEITKLRESGVVESQPKRKYTKLDKETIRKEREAIHKEIDDLLKSTAAANDLGKVVYDSLKLGKAVGKLGANYIKEGVATLDEVVAKVVGDLEARGISGATRQDVIDAIQENKGKSSRTKSELQKQIDELNNQVRKESSSVIAETKAKKALREEALSAKKAEREAKREADKAQKAYEKAKTAENKALWDEADKYWKIQQQAAKAKEAVAAKEFGEQWRYQERVFKAEEKIEDLQRQLEEGRFRVESKRERALTKELEDLKAEREFLQSEVRGRVGAERDSSNIATKAWNLPKTLKSSIDISAPGRQGWLLGMANPDKIPAAFWDQLKALSSGKKAVVMQNELFRRPNIGKYRKMKLHFSPLDGTAQAGEEAFGSQVFKGWRAFNPFRASERAYGAYLNRMRADVADRMINWLGPNATDEELEIAGNFINVFSGRGGQSVPGLEKAAEALNHVFFSPRFVASRFEAALGQPIAKGLISKGGLKGLKQTARIRGLVARQYAQMLTVMGGIYGIAKLAGAELNSDRASSDFGKIKIGNTRIDPMAGLQQGIVFGHRMLTSEYTTAKGAQLDLKSGEYGSMDKGQVAERFVRSKFSPSFGTAYSLIKGEDYLGQEYDWKNAARDLTLPISANELVEEAVKDGVNRDDFLGLLNFLGFNTSTFDATEKKDPKN